MPGEACRGEVGSVVTDRRQRLPDHVGPSELSDPPAGGENDGEFGHEGSVHHVQRVRVGTRRFEYERGELWSGDAGDPPAVSA
jgi:hypothetical protein